MTLDTITAHPVVDETAGRDPDLVTVGGSRGGQCAAGTSSSP